MCRPTDFWAHMLEMGPLCELPLGREKGSSGPQISIYTLSRSAQTPLHPGTIIYGETSEFQKHDMAWTSVFSQQHHYWILNYL